MTRGIEISDKLLDMIYDATDERLWAPCAFGEIHRRLRDRRRRPIYRPSPPRQ
jgi:hypothetical protein